jgi:hypothetical protein
VSHKKENILWGKILNVLRKRYSPSQPEIVEVIPGHPLRFQIKDSDGKFSFYTVNFKVNDSGEVVIDWTTVEMTDPY